MHLRLTFSTPAWARDEPPSPTEQIGSTTQGAQLTESRISDTSSLHSNLLPSDSVSRWWSFTSRTRQESFALLPHSTKSEKKSFRDIESDGFLPHHQVSVPTSAQLPTSVTLTQTGLRWDTPWTSQPRLQDPLPQPSRHGSEQDLAISNHEHLRKWIRKKKQIRSFILSNTYAPLVRPSIISLLQHFR